MTTYNTGNPLGSADPRDLYDNAQNLDDAVNSTADTWTDRFGRERKTLKSLEDGGGGGGGVNLVPWPMSPGEFTWARLKYSPLPSGIPLAAIGSNEIATIDGASVEGYARFGLFTSASATPSPGVGRYFYVRSEIEGNGTIDVMAWDGSSTRVLVRLKKSPAGHQVFDGADLFSPISGVSWTDWQPMIVELGGVAPIFDHSVKIGFNSVGRNSLVAEINEGEAIIIRVSHDAGHSAVNATYSTSDPSWPMPGSGYTPLEDNIPAMLELPAGVKNGDILVRTGPAGERATYRGLHYDIASNGAPATAVVVDAVAGVVSSTGGVEEAPIDGTPYARINAAWSSVGMLGLVQRLDAQLTTKTVGAGGDFPDIAAAALWGQTVIGQYLWLRVLSDLPPVDSGTVFTFNNFSALVIECRGFTVPVARYESGGAIVLADKMLAVGAAYQSLQLRNLSHVAPFPVPVEIDATVPSGMVQIENADFADGIGITVDAHGERLMLIGCNIGGFSGQVTTDANLWIEDSMVANASATELVMQGRSTIRASYYPQDSASPSAVISMSDGCVIGGISYSLITAPLNEVVTGGGSWNIGSGGSPDPGKFTTFTTRPVNQITQAGIAIVGDLPVP